MKIAFLGAFLVAMFAVLPAAAQRLDGGRARPVIDGEARPLQILIQPKNNDPDSSRRSIDGLPNAITLRVLMKIGDGTTATGYSVAVKDKSGELVARYGEADFRAKGEIWSAPVPGASATVEIEAPSPNLSAVSLAITAVASQQKPGDPMLSVIDGFDLETMEDMRTEKPEIFQVGLAVAKLSFMRDGQSLTCTGFMIDDERMLTNEHCISTQAVCDTTVALFDFHTSMTTDVMRDRTTQCAELLVADQALDVALVRLAGSPGARWGRLKLSNALPSVKEVALVIQHPNGEVKHVSRRNCYVATYPPDGLDKETNFAHICDTMGGSSGAPVLDRKNLEVIGLHHLGVDPLDATWRNLNRAVRIELIRSRLKI